MNELSNGWGAGEGATRFFALTFWLKERSSEEILNALNRGDWLQSLPTISEDWMLFSSWTKDEQNFKSSEGGRSKEGWSKELLRLRFEEKLGVELQSNDADLSSMCEGVKRLSIISFISLSKPSLALLNKSFNHDEGLESESEDSDEVEVSVWKVEELTTDVPLKSTNVSSFSSWSDLIESAESCSSMTERRGSFDSRREAEDDDESCGSSAAWFAFEGQGSSSLSSLTTFFSEP